MLSLILNAYFLYLNLFVIIFIINLLKGFYFLFFILMCFISFILCLLINME